MTKIFEILHYGYVTLKDKPDFIIFEYYEKHRKSFEHSKEAFFYLLNEEFQKCKTEVLSKFEKRSNEKMIYYPRVIGHPFTKEKLIALEQHLGKLRFHWFNENPNETKTKLVGSNDINEKDLQILRLKQQGKTEKEIASIVFTSQSNVKDRLRILREKYDCETTLSLISHLEKNKLL